VFTESVRVQIAEVTERHTCKVVHLCAHVCVRLDCWSD